MAKKAKKREDANQAAFRIVQAATEKQAISPRRTRAVRGAASPKRGPTKP